MKGTKKKDAKKETRKVENARITEETKSTT